MRRYRNFGLSTANTSARGATSTTGKVTTAKSSSSASSNSLPVRTVNPIVKESVKVISTNKNLSSKQKTKKVAELFRPIEQNKRPIVPRPPSFKEPPATSPAPSPPVATVPSPPRDSQGRPIAPGEDGIVIDDPMERDRYEQEQAEREQANRPPPPVNIIPLPIVKVAPSPRPLPSPRPPAQFSPSPRTSIRMPTAIPRTYSSNMRVSFRAPRLMLPKPTMRKLQPRPTKQKWNAMSPTYPSFMNRATHGQFSFQNRGRLFPQPSRGHSHSEIRKLQNQVNKLNADALKTRQDSMRERNALKLKLRDYELSPVTQLRDQAKGIFSVVDDASRFATPSVNGMNGFPSVGEGTSKALAVGFGLLTALFVIGRVE